MSYTVVSKKTKVVQQMAFHVPTFRDSFALHYLYLHSFLLQKVDKKESNDLPEKDNGKAHCTATVNRLDLL